MANFSGVRCDCCARVKGEGNHWLQMGVYRDGGQISVEVGDLRGPRIGEESKYVVMDLCGDQCFQKTLGKLLRLNPTEAE